MVSDSFFTWMAGPLPSPKSHTRACARSPKRERHTVIYLETSDSEYGDVSSDDSATKVKKVRFKEDETKKSSLKKDSGKEKLANDNGGSANQVSGNEHIP
jgi:hypothetical protein